MNLTLTAAPAGEVCRFEGHSHWVQCVAFSPDGRYALSGSGQPPSGNLAETDFTVRLWDVEAALKRLAEAALSPCVLAPDVPPESPRERLRLVGHTDQVSAVAFLPDGQRCLSAGHDATLRLWDLADGRALRVLVGHTDRIQTVAVSADGRLALSGGCDRTLRLWDLERGAEARHLPEHRQWVMSAAFAPDGRLALSGCLDGSMHLWDVARGREVKGGWLDALLGRAVPHFAGHQRAVTGVAFGPSGQQVLTAGMDATLRLWEAAGGRELRRFAGHQMGVTALALSADGRRAVSGGLDHSVRLWDVESGRELHHFAGHADVVSGVAFSPDGRFVLSGGADAAVRLWRLPE